MKEMSRAASIILLFLSAVLTIVPARAQPSNVVAPPPVPAPEPVTIARPPIELVGRACPFCDLRGADLSGRNLTDANLQGADLTGANLSGAILNGAILARANLLNANLEGAILGRSARGPADLSAASLGGARLRGATFDGTDLQFADLSRTDRTGIDFSRALLPDPSPPPPGRTTLTCGKADLTKLQSRIFVAPTGSDGDACGTVDSPCATIGKGISRCTGTAACGVLVQWGTYHPPATIALAAGINVYGGCTGASGADVTQSTVYAPAGGEPAMSVTDPRAGQVLQGFKLLGSDASQPGAASIAFLAQNTGNTFALLDTHIYGGRGGAGAAGQTGADGPAGLSGTGRVAGGNQTCSQVGYAGGDGGVQFDVSVSFTSPFTFRCSGSCSANGCYGFWPPGAGTGSPGARGSHSCGDCPSSAGWGYAGGPGLVGYCFQGYIAPASDSLVGSFSGTTWQPGSGYTSGAGNGGNGGAGGGAGGYKAGTSCSFPYAKVEHPGNAGGGGGGGGCGGAGGGGGQQGGASIGIATFGSVSLIPTLDLSASRVIGGRGGDGGRGGTGGKGGAGGAGAPGDTEHGGGNGGTGGAGGDGAPGGGGAGGNGGPAFGVALVHNAAIRDQTSTYYTGQSGATGAGGLQPVSSASCNRNGAAGVPGMAIDKQSF